MKKRLFVLLVVAVASVPALADPPEEAHGFWYYLPTYQAVDKIAGGNMFMTIADEGWWDGTIDGSEVDTGNVVVHSKLHWFYTGTVVFNEVTVGGKTGGLEMRVQGRRPDAFSDWDGKWMIIAASGDLAGLQGRGTWAGAGWSPTAPTVPGVVEYWGKVHFGSD